VLADALLPSGGSWSSRGEILFSAGQYGPLQRRAATARPAKPATKLAPREDTHIWPRFLPDGTHFVFLADASTTPDHSIRLASLDSPESEKLISPAVSSLGFAPPDWLLFVRAGTLVAQRLDVKARKMLGEPVPLGERIAPVDVLHGFEFSVSGNGVLLYRSADPDLQLAWFDRSGKRLANVGEPARYGAFNLSPDGRQVAFEKLDADLRHGNLWLMDASSGSVSRLTSTSGSDYSPVWSADGKRILYGSARSGLADIYETPSAGGTTEKIVFRDSQDKNPAGWSSDGRFSLLSVTSPSTGYDIWI